MNPVFREAAGLIEGGSLMGVVTAAFLLFFTVVFVRMFRPSASAIYAEAARLPLDSSESPATNQRES